LLLQVLLKLVAIDDAKLNWQPGQQFELFEITSPLNWREST